MMPVGLFLPIILALLLLVKKNEKILSSWGLNRIWALALFFGSLVLSYIDIPIGEVYLNLGGAAVLSGGIWLWLKLSWPHRWRTIAIAVILGALTFLPKTDCFGS